MIRIAEGHEWKTAFRTHFSLVKSLVMPFRLTNPPASFQEFIYDTLRPILDIFCTAFLNDLLIYCDNLTEYNKHIRALMSTVMESRLYVKVENSELPVQEVRYLGLNVGVNGIRIDPEKVSAVKEWEAQG
jgi:hypothetical protein